MSPSYFSDSRHMSFMDNLADDEPFLNTNKGISLTLPVFQTFAEGENAHVALLNCRQPGPGGQRIGVYIVQLSKNQYARIPNKLWDAIAAQSGTVTVQTHPSGSTKLIRKHQFNYDQDQMDELASLQDSVESGIKPSKVFVLRKIRLELGHYTPWVFGFQITESIQSFGLGLVEVLPPEPWSTSNRCLRIADDEWEKSAVLYYNDLIRTTNFEGLSVELQWNRHGPKFGVRCVRGRSSLVIRALPFTLSSDQWQRGNNHHAITFQFGGVRYEAAAKAELGMMGDEVVIKVAFSVKPSTYVPIHIA
ncbi:putative het domain-containing protein [Seiridium cardinale]